MVPMTDCQFFQIHIMTTAGVFFVLLSLLLLLNKNYFDRRKPAIITLQLSAAILLFADSVGLVLDGRSGSVFRVIIYIADFLSFLFADVTGIAFLSYISLKLFDNKRLSEFMLGDISGITKIYCVTCDSYRHAAQY